MFRPHFIGIDLGGTRIKAVVVDVHGAVLESRSVKTHGDGPDAWAQCIANIVHDFEARLGVATGMGLAAPGLASPDGRKIAHLPGRLKGLVDLDWTVFLDRRDAVVVLNDAHACLQGEHWVGCAKGMRDVVLLTLGTGVGGAILQDGKVRRGRLGRAGHVGHISLDVDGPPSILGTPGSLESAIGECSVVERCQGRFRSTQELVAAAHAGNAFAQEVWRRSIRKLACGITSLINVLDPEAVVLGGGIALAGEALLLPLRQELDRVEWRPGGQQVALLTATQADFGGAIGAAAEAYMKRNT